MPPRRAPTRRTPLPRPAEALGRPFDLPGGPDAALLLHGLSGSPFELRALADRLYLEGIHCVGPLMAGHGGDPEALRRVLWTDWVAKAREDLLRLQGARRTLLVGCSMGALVALALAHDHPDRVDGLALLAPALRLAPGPALGGFLARRTPLGGILPPLPKGTSDVRDDEMRRLNPAMKHIPLSAVGELQRLAAHVDRLLPGVAAPAIVFAGARDHTVRLSGVRRVARRIGSAPARLVVLRDSFHLLGIDVERDVVADEVASFFSKIPIPGGR
jgi:carboxylesterase